jgi:chromosome segregation ATPase
MDEHHRTSENESPESLNSGDLLTQLKEKLKVQAQRIRSLESYKVLCEERLLELCPSHPLPVQPEHIGSGGPSLSQELLTSRQKIAKLEQQLSQTAELVPSPSNSVTYNKLHELYTLLHQKYNATLKEKNELEESLRNEVISSEEQRAYIEVLKQAIEIRMEALGLKGVRPDEFAEFSQMRISVDDSRRETSRITTKISDYEAQIKSLTESLKIKTAECAEANNDRDVLTEQLHQAAEALQFAEEEVMKLEEEKTNLIDYVETQAKVEQELSSDLKDLKAKYSNIQDENRKLSKSIQTTGDESKKILNELESVKNEFNRNERTLKDTQQSFINLKARAEEKDKSIQKYREENNNLSIQNTGLQAENISLSENLAKTDQELKMIKTLLENQKLEDERLKENLSQTKNSLHSLQEEKNRLEKTSFETHHRLTDVTRDFDDLTQKLNQTHKTLQNYSNDLETLKNQNRIAADKEEAANHLVQELKKQNQKFQNELDNLVKLQQSTHSELKTTRQEADETKAKLLMLSKEKEALEGKLREFNSMLESESQNFRHSQKENDELVYKIEELSKNCMFANESCEDTENQLKHCQLELQNLSDLLERTHQDLEQEKYQRSSHYEDLVKLSSENEKIKRDLASLRESLDLSLRATRNLSSHSNNTLLKDLQFSDKSNDLALHKWIEAVIREVSEVSQKLVESSQNSENFKQKNSILMKENEKLNNDVSEARNRETLLKTQHLESLNREISGVKESFKSQVNVLQLEIVSLRNSMNGLYDEIDELSSKNRGLNSELMQVRSKLVTSEQGLVNYEKKYKIVLSERDQLERIINKSPLRSNI